MLVIVYYPGTEASISKHYNFNFFLFQISTWVHVCPDDSILPHWSVSYSVPGLDCCTLLYNIMSLPKEFSKKVKIPCIFLFIY